ncbi:MAG: TetR/AcrR family transcriptional regulator [Myxococcota bacterium]
MSTPLGPVSPNTAEEPNGPASGNTDQNASTAESAAGPPPAEWRKSPVQSADPRVMPSTPPSASVPASAPAPMPMPVPTPTPTAATGAAASAIPGAAPVTRAKRIAPKRAEDKRPKLRADDGRLARGRKSRARIREAARSLFREKGFDGATLREIAARAGMGASSIYRHVQSKEELLIEELSEMQEEAWTRFRALDDRDRPTDVRLRDFFEVQHALLVADRDLTTIALRATTKTEARVAKRVLQLYDRTIGLLMEILQRGRLKKHLSKEVDVLETARVLFHVTNGARIPWANGMVSDEACLASIHQAVDLLFRGVGPAR